MSKLLTIQVTRDQAIENLKSYKNELARLYSDDNVELSVIECTFGRAISALEKEDKDA